MTSAEATASCRPAAPPAPPPLTGSGRAVSAECPVQPPIHGFGQRGPNPAAVSVVGRLGTTPHVPRGAFQPVLTQLGPSPRRTTAAARRLTGMHPGFTGRIFGSAAGFKYT